MDDLYQNLYYHLFNSITDALCATETQHYAMTRDILIRAQQIAEDRYIHAEE